MVACGIDVRAEDLGIGDGEDDANVDWFLRRRFGRVMSIWWETGR